MKAIYFIAIFLIAQSSCTSKQGDRTTQSRTAIFFHYLDKTFGPDVLPFDASQETHVVLYTGYGCSYCNKATLNYVSKSALSNLIVLSSASPVQLKNLEKGRVYYDTIAKNLPRVNLRTGEGPVYLRIQENKVTAYVFITSNNVDSLFTAIEN